MSSAARGYFFPRPGPSRQGAVCFVYALAAPCAHRVNITCYVGEALTDEHGTRAPQFFRRPVSRALSVHVPSFSAPPALRSGATCCPLARHSASCKHGKGDAFADAFCCTARSSVSTLAHTRARPLLRAAGPSLGDPAETSRGRARTSTG
ncbi:unnamed protein product [Prorocentrum cordatum]|uniref:Uncharacterized protein n=1 Tax=Prorocentrum cordatum TaxID=2364126 RepID=A0ABN9WJH6_9DINO|nr:unnamed protein product [Polarella glacialis]